MAKVTVRVDRDPESQPSWANNFLTKHEFNDALMIVSKKNAIIPVQILLQKYSPFSPPVTLVYGPDHAWSFTWESEEAQTMFLLRW